jgi:hypothetical protein
MLDGNNKSRKYYSKKAFRFRTRWMMEEGIRSKTKKKHKPARSSYQLPISNLPEQRFHAEKPNQV